MQRKQRSYILFIDESGKSKLSDIDDNFLLSGFVIDRDLHTALSQYMLSLKEKSEIPVDENIHAFDLFEREGEKMLDGNGKVIKNNDGTSKHRRIPYTRVDIFFGRLCTLIEGSDAHGFVYQVDKTKQKEKIKKVALKWGVSEKTILKYIKRQNLNDFLYESLARKMILEFAHFLQTVDAVGEVVAESRREEDSAVLDAFLVAGQKDKFIDTPRFYSWSKESSKRIHSLTFQNKKGLSFGLEVADLFGWANFNHSFGTTFPSSSAAKKRRVQLRVDRANELRASICRNNTEVVSENMLKNIAHDRVSEFSKALKEFRHNS